MQALLEAGSADEQRNFLVNCKLPFHPAPHKQVGDILITVSVDCCIISQSRQYAPPIASGDCGGDGGGSLRAAAGGGATGARQGAERVVLAGDQQQSP